MELYMPISFASSFIFFSGYVYYKLYHLRRNFWELLPTGPSDSVVYSSQQTGLHVIINLDDRMLRKVPGYNGQNITAACLTWHVVSYTGI